MGLSDLSVTPDSTSDITDPIEIFDGLTLRGQIEGMWSTQSQALEAWHTERNETDVVVRMNTGGGKTLVGLLVAQSMINEKKRGVLYVCPTNQLVEQICKQANECGLETASYIGGNWDNREVFDRARGVCVTNYHAVFNGKSIFAREDICGVVFDDAHVAGDTIRSNYTLELDYGSELYRQVLTRIAPWFRQHNQGRRLEEIQQGRWGPLLFLPMFQMHGIASQIEAVLSRYGVEETQQVFPWEHLKDHLDRCCLHVSSRGIEIAPLSLPVHQLQYFDQSVRRIYLTATLPTRTELIRTFGASDPVVIEPEGKSGEPQRQFNFMPGDSGDEQRRAALKIIKDRKAAIIVPSNQRAQFWSPVGTVLESSNGEATLEEFRESESPSKLILVARYDGIDLPGASCRILVLDGVPRGEALIDRFLDEGLRVRSHRSSKTAIRLIQAIGRIFRGNTDHGAVLICGEDLRRWFTRPHNQAFLPDLIQKQINFGYRLEDNVQSGIVTYEELLNGVLEGHEEWDKQYNKFIRQADKHDSNPEPSWLIRSARFEKQAFRDLWDGRYSEAATTFGDAAESAIDNDEQLSALYRHFEGLSLQCEGNRQQSNQAYFQACSIRSVLGRPDVKDPEDVLTSTVQEVSNQAEKVSGIYRERGNSVYKTLDEVRDSIEYGEAYTNGVEDALRKIGHLIGLNATRPDEDELTGPDVVWLNEGEKEGLSIEAKTGKDPDQVYLKRDDIGHYLNHMQYLDRHMGDYVFHHFIVGRVLPVASGSNPPDQLVIVPLREINTLVDRVRSLYDNLRAGTSDEVEVHAQKWMDALGLLWPEVVTGLDGRLAIDLVGADEG